MGPHRLLIHVNLVEFQWGDKDDETFCKLIGDAFEVVVHWRHNSFLVPPGKAGEDFVLELAKLYHVYADNTTLHSVALTACCVFRYCYFRSLMTEVNPRIMCIAWNVVLNGGTMVILML